MLFEVLDGVPTQSKKPPPFVLLRLNLGACAFFLMRPRWPLQLKPRPGSGACLTRVEISRPPSTALPAKVCLFRSNSASFARGCIVFCPVWNYSSVENHIVLIFFPFWLVVSPRIVIGAVRVPKFINIECLTGFSDFPMLRNCCQTRFYPVVPVPDALPGKFFSPWENLYFCQQSLYWCMNKCF